MWSWFFPKGWHTEMKQAFKHKIGSKGDTTEYSDAFEEPSDAELDDPMQVRWVDGSKSAVEGYTVRDHRARLEVVKQKKPKNFAPAPFSAAFGESTVEIRIKKVQGNVCAALLQDGGQLGQLVYNDNSEEERAVAVMTQTAQAYMSGTIDKTQIKQFKDEQAKLIGIGLSNAETKRRIPQKSPEGTTTTKHAKKEKIAKDIPCSTMVLGSHSHNLVPSAFSNTENENCVY